MCDREEVRNELDVSCSMVGFVDNGDMFLLDSWEQCQALMYLIGIYQINEYDIDANYNVYLITLEGLRFDLNDKSKIVNGFYKKLERLQTIWDSGAHSKLNAPEYYIEWALSKGLEIPWLKYAIEQGFYKSKQLKEIKSKPLADRERETMVKIIHALAKNGYRYPSHGSIKDMTKDFQLNKNGVSDKTLTKYLDEFDTL